MTKKFTEEQYQEIVKTQEVDFSETLMGAGANGDFFEETISEGLARFIGINCLEDEAMALANPITRKWAHDQFVEEENKYRWKYKKIDDDGDAWYLLRNSGLIVPGVSTITFDAFTETEIIEAGYIPDMYEKKEVE